MKYFLFNTNDLLKAGFKRLIIIVLRTRMKISIWTIDEIKQVQPSGSE